MPANIKNIESADSISIGGKTALLSALEYKGNNDVCVLVIPGLTIPKESYTVVASAMQPHTTIIIDLQGQGDSGGEIDFRRVVSDINHLGLIIKEKYSSKTMIAIGHSFGGLALLFSSTDVSHPFDYRIALAPPAVLSQAAGIMPRHFTILATYIYNLIRACKSKAFRCSIASKHMRLTPLSYFRKPSIVALPVTSAESFNDLINGAPNLDSFLPKIAVPSDIIYAGDDSRLSNEGKHRAQYSKLKDICAQVGVDWYVIPNVNHRFNLLPEEELQLSYNNESLTNLLRSLVERFVNGRRANKKP